MSPKRSTKSPKAAKIAKSATAKKEPPKKVSMLAAAAKILAEAKAPMNTREMIETMATKGAWKSPSGKTPHATLFSAILREIATKGKESRFKKTERGKFAYCG